MSKVVIRKARFEDIEAIVDINIKDWKKAYKGIIDDSILNNLDRNEKIEKWKKRFDPECTIVAEENGCIIGYCRYDDDVSGQGHGIDSEIIALYVDYDKTRYGIGQKLMEYVKNDLKNKNKFKMVIWCLEENRIGRSFYEKMGGILIEDEKYYEKDGKRYKEVGYVYDI